jgi:hypothetical protein
MSSKENFIKEALSSNKGEPFCHPEIHFNQTASTGLMTLF